MLPRNDAWAMPGSSQESTASPRETRSKHSKRVLPKLKKLKTKLVVFVTFVVFCLMQKKYQKVENFQSKSNMFCDFLNQKIVESCPKAHITPQTSKAVAAKAGSQKCTAPEKAKCDFHGLTTRSPALKSSIYSYISYIMHYNVICYIHIELIANILVNQPWLYTLSYCNVLRCFSRNDVEYVCCVSFSDFLSLT